MSFDQICYTQLPVCDGCPCHTICHGYSPSDHLDFTSQIQLGNTDDELYQIETALEYLS